MIKSTKDRALPQIKIAVLGIGTELTSGQILNRNGQWISQKMKGLGIQTSCHLVIPDDRPLILTSLKFCSEQADILFVTGGLGPTSDDFTRDVISEWTQKKLVFHEPSWTHINERLSTRGIVVREIQRQQCYYPEGSKVLFNRNGTANAFYLQHDGQDIFVLPGPPKEIETVWNDSIAEILNDRCRGYDRFKTQSWDCIGVGESEISHLAEAALAGRPSELGFDIGYRVHLPYVEFKVSYFESVEAEAQPWLKAVTEALSPHCVLTDGDDIAELLAKKLKVFEKVVLVDALTGQCLLQRLFAPVKPLLTQHRFQFVTELEQVYDTNTLVLKIESAGASTARVSFTYRGQTHADTFESTYINQLMKERELQYFAELAMLFWAQQIR